MKLACFFGKLRGKFLLFFTVGMTLTLIVVFAVNYFGTYSTFNILNEEIATAEFNQISVGLNTIISNLENLIETELIAKNALYLFAQHKEERNILYIHAINQLKDTVARLTASFPYIKSVCFYVGTEKIIFTSSTNTREIYMPHNTIPPERVMDAMQNASRAFQVLGGIFQKDLSVYTDETSHKQPIVTLYRSLYVRQKNITCAVNIDENQLYKLYSGLNSGKAREIRLLTLDGIIISSSNKEEIGTQYNQIPPDYLANDGKATVEGKKKIQVVWKKINDLGIVVVVDTPLKGYTDILSMNQIRIASIFLVGILITCTMFFFWLNRILHPLDKLIYGMHLVGNGDYTQRLPHKGTDEFSILTRQYNHMLDDLISFQERQHTTELEIRESELRALRNQINPHFLYNTLNAVKWMARFSGAENIDKCISALGAIIVPLYKDNSPRCTLQKELELLNNYLIIMNIRYNNKITFRQQIPPHLLETEIPRFILQPLVENSIQYSYAGSSTNAIITLIASCSKETLTLLLSDNGRGMTKQAINEYNDIFIRNRPSSGVGMVNVNRRIRLQYGDAYGIRLQPNTPCGLNVILELPLTYTENK